MTPYDPGDDLTIAHLDCDAFYASVEKRDRPELMDAPVIIGGGRRGVVATACYIARAFGVRSAMPMFKALKACPDAVVIKPDMAKYSAVSRQIRTLMDAVTPAVQAVSVDEAYLDLAGTERLHNAPPGAVLMALQRRIETDIGVTTSVGLSYNKALAKLASEYDKPRGFAVITEADAPGLLAALPLRALPGVGPAFAKALAAQGLSTGADVLAMPEKTLIDRFGEAGLRLAQLSRGVDRRPVHSGSARKSISAETTFEDDLSGLDALSTKLWRCCERVSARAKALGLAGRSVTVKLKSAGFATRTRACRLPQATQMAHRIFAAAEPLLRREARGERFRLIGVALAGLSDARADTDAGDLFDISGAKHTQAERAMDAVRAKFGDGAVVKGRGFAPRGD